MTIRELLHSLLNVDRLDEDVSTIATIQKIEEDGHRMGDDDRLSLTIKVEKWGDRFVTIPRQDI